MDSLLGTGGGALWAPPAPFAHQPPAPGVAETRSPPRPGGWWDLRDGPRAAISGRQSRALPRSARAARHRRRAGGGPRWRGRTRVPTCRNEPKARRRETGASRCGLQSRSGWHLRQPAGQYPQQVLSGPGRFRASRDEEHPLLGRQQVDAQALAGDAEMHVRGDPRKFGHLPQGLLDLALKIGRGAAVQRESFSRVGGAGRLASG
jgi:hypothetical protein